MKDFFTAFSCENSSLFVEHCPNLCLSDLSLFRDSGLDRTPKLTGHFGSGNIRKLFLSTFKFRVSQEKRPISLLFATGCPVLSTAPAKYIAT